MLTRVYKVEEDRQLSSLLISGLVRIIAVHHHPMPLVPGEEAKLLGIKYEQHMYFENPASFLRACLDLGAQLILHGHRHVTGLTRYSALTRRANYVDPWETIYVLSCPSSTGRSCEAGFNIVRPVLSSESSYLDVHRFYRPENKGKFENLGDHPGGYIRLYMTGPGSWDVGLDVQIQIEKLPKTDNCAEGSLFPLLEQLFRRQAFHRDIEGDWGSFLYAVIRTRIIWEQEAMPRIRNARQKAAEMVRNDLLKLEDYVSTTVYEMDGATKDRLMMDSLRNKSEFVHGLPRFAGNETKWNETRTSLIRSLQDNLKEMTIAFTFGEQPPETNSEAPSSE